MKITKHLLAIAISAILLTSCSALFGGGYGYDRGGYYDNDPYYSNNTGGYYAGENEGFYNRGNLDYNTFYRTLSPYGKWINTREYGRVWVPNVGDDFHPYGSNGYWAMTDYGNTWVSNYDWGWAPFHYGRWYYDDFYGWSWIPGYEWAPAWVSWRSGGGYYGWAPLGPRMGISININIPSRHWMFISDRYMYDPYMYRYYNRYNDGLWGRTTIINNTFVYNNNRYFSGPSSNDFYRSTGRRVVVNRLSNSQSPGRSTVSGRSVNIYNPQASTRSSVNTRQSTSRSSSIYDRGTSTRGTTYDRGTTGTRGTYDRQGTTTRTQRDVYNDTRSTKQNTTDRSVSVTRSQSDASEGRSSRDVYNSSRSQSSRNDNNNTATRTYPQTRATQPQQMRNSREYTPRESAPRSYNTERSSSRSSEVVTRSGSSRKYDTSNNRSRDNSSSNKSSEGRTVRNR